MSNDVARIVDAALAAWQGDLAGCAEVLCAAGCHVTNDRGPTLIWNGGPGVQAGGISVGGDPISPFVQLMFATRGQAWALLPEAKAMQREVNRRWKLGK